MAETNKAGQPSGRSSRGGERRRYFRPKGDDAANPANPTSAPSEQPESSKVGGRTGAKRTSAQRNSGQRNNGPRNNGQRNNAQRNNAAQSNAAQSNAPQSNETRNNDSKNSEARNGEARNSEPRNNEARSNETRTNEPRSNEPRSGGQRNNSQRSGGRRGGSGGQRGTAQRGGSQRGGSQRDNLQRSASVDQRAKPVDLDERRSRRRRRRRGDRSESVDTRQESVLVSSSLDYNPPQSVYVYTYVSRGDLNERYESKVEHFSSIGRTIDDYGIDLSKLIDEDGTIHLPKMDGKIAEWEEEPADLNALKEKAADPEA